ncbi:MAG: nitrile hydratase subunit beta [Thermodesulfobacteriota bacterium]
MNGIHDMGGMDGFGRVVVERDEPVFHHAWEGRVFASTVALVASALGGVDALRFAIERMAPEHYLRASYYERWLTALATRLVERGLVTRDELEARAGGAFPLAGPLPELPPPPPVQAPSEPRFAVGDAVRVRNAHPAGHTRAPRYVRGRRGTIVRVDHRCALPDVAARDGAARREEWAYGVRFAAGELWGDDAPAADAVHVDLWESYLEPA